jgi:1,4-dihydroxy-2-naphthoate octaprenyltransferase
MRNSPVATHPGGSPRVWLRAIRAFSFTASVVPILSGAAVAAYHGEEHLLLTLIMFLASIATHAGANLANDYFDDQRGIDTDASLGPSGVIQDGSLSASQVRTGMFVAFGVATLLGLAIVAVSGWPVFVLALVSLVIAYAYTGGPEPLGYVGLGEVAVFLAMGPAMVVGSTYVLNGQLTWVALAFSVPIGCLVAAILHVNNMRDVDLDRAAGKTTLATRLGRSGANREFRLLIAGAYASLPLVVAVDWRLFPTLLPIVSVPGAIRLVRHVTHFRDALALNVGVRRTAALHFRFGLLLIAGLLTSSLMAF